MATRSNSKTLPAPSEALLRLMYCSISAPSLTRGGLEAIHQAAVIKNQAQGITGALITDKRLNIQFLEGPGPAVRSLWARIQADPRHHCIVQLQEEEQLGPRWFPDLPMRHSHASRAEMLAMVRSAYLKVATNPRPVWSQSIAPLMVLLDGEFSHPYTDTRRGEL
jgi:Sensors of blue-light using FAD